MYIYIYIYTYIHINNSSCCYDYNDDNAHDSDHTSRINVINAILQCINDYYNNNTYHIYIYIHYVIL